MTDAQGVLIPIVSVVGAVLLAFLAATVVGALVRSAARRSPAAADLSRRSRRPLRAVLVVTAVWVALRASTRGSEGWQDSVWRTLIEHALVIAFIAALTWLVGTLAFVFEDMALSRYRTDMKDNRHARRVRTQVQLLRRITVAILVVVGVAAVLLTFPGVSRLGASILASAGVLSVVAGLAAQSSLANVFAGLQIAFTDGIRVDDVVIVEEEWGRIEEITLTYVVVHIWDDRRLILPSTYFTSTPFENWTRRAAELLGTVELDVDWQVPVVEMRLEFNRLLDATDLWDRRVGVLQVTDAVGGYVRLRALASAVDAPTLFDLRCYVREGLVAWLQSAAPQGLPRTRIETGAGVPGLAGATDGPGPVLDGGPTTGAGASSRLPAAAEASPATGAGGEPDRGPVAPAPGAPGPSSPAPTPSPAQPPVAGQHDTQRIHTGQLDARLFTGTIDAIERSRSFTGPGAEVIDEREETAARSGDDPATGEVTVVFPARRDGADGTGEDSGAMPSAAGVDGAPGSHPSDPEPADRDLADRDLADHDPSDREAVDARTTSTPATRALPSGPPTAVVPAIELEDEPDPETPADGADAAAAGGTAVGGARRGGDGPTRPAGPTRSSGHVPARRRDVVRGPSPEDPELPGAPRDGE